MDVYEIPSELWLYVFKLIADDPPDGGDSVIAGTRLSHVCRRWRELALALQELWSTVPRTTTAFTALCLSRSPTVSLDFSVKTLFLGTEAQRQAVQSIYPHFGRVKRMALTVHESRLYMYATHPISLSELEEALRAQPLCALEDLTLNLIAYPGEAYGPQQIMPNQLSRTLFPSTLRGFACRNVILQREQYLTFSNIRRIDFVRVKAWYSLEDMAAFFRSMPLLESFSHTSVKINSFAHLITPELPALRSVQLKYLRKFRFRGWLPQAYAAFSSLALPPSATLIIRDDQESTYPGAVYVYEGDENQYTQLLVRITTALQDHFAAAIARGVHYEGVHLSANVIRPLVFTENPSDMKPWVHADVLPPPGELELQIPGTHIYSQSNPVAALEAAASKFILPIFSPAETVELGELVDSRHATEFTSAREVQLKGSTTMIAFSHGPSRAALEVLRIVGVALDDEGALEKCFRVVRRLREAEREVRLEFVKCNVPVQALESLREIMRPWQVICRE